MTFTASWMTGAARVRTGATWLTTGRRWRPRLQQQVVPGPRPVLQRRREPLSPGRMGDRERHILDRASAGRARQSADSRQRPCGDGLKGMRHRWGCGRGLVRERCGVVLGKPGSGRTTAVGPQGGPGRRGVGRYGTPDEANQGKDRGKHVGERPNLNDPEGCFPLLSDPRRATTPPGYERSHCRRRLQLHCGSQQASPAITRPRQRLRC